MAKRIEATSKKDAWEIVNQIFPSDYTEDSKSSEQAGYPVYRSSVEFYDYICDLGDRLEVNLKNGCKTINVWIVKPQSETLKFVKTDFDIQVNGSSSWIVYVTKTREGANAIHNMAMTQKAIHGGSWYYTVSTNKVKKDCRVPAFFHDCDYWVTCVEHNNGDWNSAATYTLYVVE